ncbi:hypothetical protein PO124_16235 [Bacillus licheniformis]|nr:hypothetical protein [Bacillus licheniformis]
MYILEFHIADLKKRTLFIERLFVKIAHGCFVAEISDLCQNSSVLLNGIKVSGSWLTLLCASEVVSRLPPKRETAFFAVHRKRAPDLSCS